jgi:serine/threonine protein kinase
MKIPIDELLLTQKNTEERNIHFEITQKNLPHTIKALNSFFYHSETSKNPIKRELILIMEYAKYGSLDDFMKTQVNGKLTEQQASSFLFQALVGLNALHANGIYHLDLKVVLFYFYCFFYFLFVFLSI